MFLILRLPSKGSQNSLTTRISGRVPVVAHACNPTFSGGRDQEDQGSMPTQENSSWEPILKIPSTKQGREHLPSKWEALSSNHNTEEKNILGIPIAKYSPDVCPSCGLGSCMRGKTCPNYLAQYGFFFFCSAGGTWTQGLHLEPLHQPPFFCEGFFEIGALELFAWAGFEPWSSWSLPLE
jgi:hypothetical protein